MKSVRLGAVVDNVVEKRPLLTGERVDLEDIESGSGRIRSAPLDRPGERLCVRAGDVLFGKLRPYLRKSLLIETEMACSPEFLVLRPRSELSGQFLSYVVQSDEFVSAAVASTDGAKMPRTSFDKLRDVRVPVPNRRRQRDIAEFLDAETARIDALTSARERQRALLTERHRTRVAGRVATAGNPIRLASAVAFIEQGASPQCEGRQAGPGEVGVLKLSAVSARGFLATENKRLSADRHPRRAAVVDADLLVTRANTPNLVGLAAVVRLDSDAPTLLLPDLIYRLTLRDGHDPDYVQLALSTPDARGQMTAAARGSSQSMVKLRGDDLRELRVPLPSIARQRRIVHEAREERAAIDLTLAAIDRQIALLRERRQALITAAVMGKLQVPDTRTANAGS